MSISHHQRWLNRMAKKEKEHTKLCKKLLREQLSRMESIGQLFQVCGKLWQQIAKKFREKNNI